MSRTSPPDFPQEVFARTPAPTGVAADRARQAEFERALNHKPDAHEQRRDAEAHRLDSGDPDASWVLEGDLRYAADKPSQQRKPLTEPESDIGPADEPAEKHQASAQSELESVPPRLPTAAEKQPEVAPERPVVAAGQRENAPVTAKHEEPGLPVPPGPSATGPVAELPSEQQDSSPEQEQQPPLIALLEEPTAAAGMTQTPGDKLLARLLNNIEPPPLSKDLDKLLQTLQPQIHAAITRNGSTTLLQVNLTQLGQVGIQLAHSHGHLHVDIQASPGSLLQLQLARGDLMERLQRLNPGQPIQLTFNQHQSGSDQGSRQRRHVQDEWEQDS
nr:type III secretion system needle length determinant PscP [Pseudomonas sp. FFPRI_1]